MASNHELTQKEQRVLQNSWMAMKAFPELDWDKLAHLCGHTNPASTRNIVNVIRKKLKAQAEAAGDEPIAGPSTATPKTGKASTPRKRKAAQTEGGDEATPTKSKRGKKPLKSEEFVKDESDEEKKD